MTRLSSDIYEKSLRHTLSQSGPRYYPGIDSSYPNLPVKELLRFHDGLRRTGAFQAELTSSLPKIKKHLNEDPFLNVDGAITSDLQDLRTKSRDAFVHLQHIFGRINRNGSTPFEYLPFGDILVILNDLFPPLMHARSALMRRQEDHTRAREPSGDSIQIERVLHCVNGLIQIVSPLHRTCESDAAAAANDPFCFLLGQGGSGKTHFLCDLAKSRVVDLKLPTIVVLAHELDPLRGDIICAMIRHLGLACTKRQFLTFLNNQAIEAGERTLIAIDALNESSNRAAWKSCLRRFRDDVGQYRGLAVLLSIRTPFEELMVPARVFRRAPKASHTGFAGMEDEAQVVLFEHYELPSTEVPLLADEFTNPLFLGVFCRALSEAVHKNKHPQVKKIASGLAGMTYILEQFIEAVERSINKRLARSRFANHLRIEHWLWGKGRRPGLVKDLAEAMAERPDHMVTEVEARQCLSTYFNSRAAARYVLRELLSEGILREVLVKNDGRPQVAIGFAYEKFSDHLITRTIYRRKSSAEIESYILQHDWQRNPSLFEALMIEYTHRNPGKELLDLFDHCALEPWHLGAFVRGLYWRAHADFNARTWFYTGLAVADETTHSATVEAMFSLATKLDHEFGSKRLHNYLSVLPMSERDLQWSEFLRIRQDGSAISRLLTWIQNHSPDATERTAVTYMHILRWLLTSTDKGLRDKATRALVLLGGRYPAALLSETLSSLQIDDPYVSERMFASSYGACMRLHSQLPSPQFLTTEFMKYGRSLYREMFRKRAQHSTTHALARDYARGILEIAMLHNTGLFSQREVSRIRPPYSAGGIRRWGQADDRDFGDGNSPLRMDFRTYTMSRLSPDSSHTKWELLLRHAARQLVWRMKELGYSHAKFKEADKDVAYANSYSSRNNSTKVERYGKKYAWIPFFELYGLRQDKGIIGPTTGVNPRPSDCDIDPSFPVPPQNFRYFRKDLLQLDTLSAVTWLNVNHLPTILPHLRRRDVLGCRNRWIMLRAYVNQQDMSSKRDASITASGILVHDRKRDEFVSFLRKGRLRNHDFNRPDSSNYLFAGEVPWCDKWQGNQVQSAHAVVSRTVRTVLTRDAEYIKDGKVLDEREVVELFETMKTGKNGIPTATQFDRVLRKNRISVQETLVPQREVVTKEKSLRYEYATHSILWESYHSSENETWQVTVPTKGILKSARLKHRDQDWCFYDQQNQLGAAYVECGDTFRNRQEAVFVREDILQSCLRKRRMTLIWILWGERQIVLNWEGTSPDIGPEKRPIREHISFRVFDAT